MTPLPPGACKALLFDMDDTLYPERQFVLCGFDAVAAWAQQTLGIPAEATARDLRRLFAQGVRGDTFDRWLAARGLQQQASQLMPQMVDAYRHCRPQLQPFAHAARALLRYRRRCKIGLVSDGYLQVQQRKFEALGLAPSFDTVVFSDAWGREAWKPSERPFREALRRLEVDPEEAVYVGDNPHKDFLAPRRLGMRAIWLRLPDGQYSQRRPPADDHAPHATVTSWPQLVQLIDALLN